MSTQQGQAFEDLRNTLSECARIVRYRWRISLAGLSLVGAVAFWFSQYLPREYSATTLFERRDDVVLQNLVQNNSPYGFDHLKTTMILDMTGSRALARAAVGANLLPAETFTSSAALSDKEREALEGVVGRYKLRANVKLLHSTASLDTIELSCRAADPQVARKFVTALRDSYISDTRDRIRDILVGTKQFFESEITRLQQQAVDDDARAQAGFEEFPGLDPTNPSDVGSRLEMLRAQRDSSGQRKGSLEAEVAAREQFLANAPTWAASDEEPAEVPPLVARPAGTVVDQTLDKAVEDVQHEIVNMITARRMTREHPTVRAAYARLEALQNLRTALAEMPAPPLAEAAPAPAVRPKPSEGYREWQAQRMRVELELDSLRKQLELASTQANEAESRLARFEQLYANLRERDPAVRALVSRKGETKAELSVWQGYLSRLERIAAAESGDRGTQFTLLEEPEDVARPTQPRVASIFVVCSGLGLAAATLLVALAELFDRSFRSVGQVTRTLGIPVLECIGTVPTPRERRKHLMSRMFWGPTLGVLLLSLATSAALAYVSLQMPALHQRAMQRFDRMLGNVGVSGFCPVDFPHS